MRIGPRQMEVMLPGIVGPRLTVSIPEGVYSSVRFTLHKVTSNAGDDATFRQVNPDFRDISARHVGTYYGVPFIFVTDVNAKLNVPLSAPLTVGADGWR